MWLRQLPGYGRLENPPLVELINEPCRAARWPLINFCLPGLKLAEKWRERSNWRRRYEPAQTAYQRLMASQNCHARIVGGCGIALRVWTPFVLKQHLQKRLKKSSARSRPLPEEHSRARRTMHRA
jgi:hypothetical protein